MTLAESVHAVFAPNGPLAGAVQEYRRREGQLQMAVAVAEVMEQGGMLVVEAGTGVGKTYAYLVPALLSGQRVLLSTATKALQDQLFGRDIPQLLGLLGVALRVAVLKGRSSYLCLYRTALARQDRLLEEPAAMLQLGRIEQWAQATHTGDLAEVDSLEEGSPLLPLLTSTRDNCLGSRCPQASQCFVNQARREAMAADVVVVNHHLFFADLNVRESGVAELLPSVNAVVFDEAHQLNEIGVQFLGRQWSTDQLKDFARDLLQTTEVHARGLAAWHAIALGLQECGQALRAHFPARDAAERLDWSAVGEGLQRLMAQAQAALAQAETALETVAEMAPELNLLRNRAADLAENLGLFVQPLANDAVRWLEYGRQLRLLQSPLDVSQAMQSRVLPANQDGSTQTSRPNTAWVFTSATLGHDEGLSWMVDNCGLAGARVLKVPSPFDYAQQAALYVPPNFPPPGDAAHSQAVAALALQGALQLGGRTLVLTTTLRAMNSIGEALQRSLQAQAQAALGLTSGSALGLEGGLELLLQGKQSKRELLERFMACGKQAGRGAILVGSATFWEGIDMPGEALQLLLIDKLPFAPPDDPVQQARAKALEEGGKKAFMHLHLPQAAVALRQGAGRLIRRESDRGVLVVCDVRLLKKGYGRKLIAALPPMQRLANAEEFALALAAIASKPCYPAV